MGYKKQNFVDDQTLTAEHMNHIEEGIALNADDINQLKESIFETVYELTWDGNTDGKTCVVVDGESLCKVSDATPILSDFANGGIVGVKGGGETYEEEFSSEVVTEPLPDLIFMGTILIVGEKALSINIGGHVFTETGTYFVFGNSEETGEYMHISKLKINGYTGFTETKIKKDFIPDEYVTQDELKEVVENLPESIEVDSELSATSENPVQNKVITSEINQLKESIANKGKGLTEAQINALDGLFKIATYTKEPSAEYNAFKTAFNIGGTDEPDIPVEPDIPEVTLTSISAVYTGGEVPVGTSVNSLTGITVTAHYSDGSSANVTGYTLSGTISEGSNTITVSYSGLITTFTVIGIEEVEAVVYNVFDGEYQNSGYSGTLHETYGSNMEVYKTQIDVTNADTLYMRLAKSNNGDFYGDTNIIVGVYSDDGAVLGTIKTNDPKVTVVDSYGEVVANVGWGVIETLEDGTVIRTKGILSISLADYPTKSYVLMANKRGGSAMALTWSGNAQSTSPLTLEGWV